MFELFIAAFPILVIFILLFLFKQTAVRSGLAAYAVSVIIALFFSSFHLDANEILHASIKGVLITSIVAYVLLFGILLFHLMNEKGLIKSIAHFISNTTDDPVRQVILLVICFSPLVESVSGFGLAAVIIAPILIQLGFQPFKAALLSLVSLNAVPWGALATGTVIGANIAEVSLRQIGTGSALLSIAPFLLFAVITVYIAGGIIAFKKRGVELAIVSASFLFTNYLFNSYVSVELAGVFSAIIGASMELIFIKLITAKRKKGTTKSLAAQHLLHEAKIAHPIVYAVSPYLFLTALLLMSRLIPFFQNFFTAAGVLSFPQYDFSLAILYSPGFFLLLTCLFTITLLKIKRTAFLKACKLSGKQWTPVVIAMIGFIAMSEVMTLSGMTTSLAGAQAEIFGPTFELISPLIGAIGGFLTGSNAGANAMFISLQAEAAKLLHIPTENVATAQNTSASYMTVASPSRVMLAVTVCNIKEEESNLQKKIAYISLISLLFIMIGVWIKTIG